MEDLWNLKRKFNAASIYFLDSTFTINRKYVVELCERMIEEKLNMEWWCCSRTDRVDRELLTLMKKAGCDTISYGIESGNMESLKVLKKAGTCTPEQQMEAVLMTKEVNIKVLCSFILGVPGENKDMVENTIRYAKKMSPHTALFYLPTPYPGSELFEICMKDGGIRPDYKWEDLLSIDYENPVYINPLLGKDLMKYYYRKAFRDFYFSPRTIINNLKTIKDFHDVKKYFKATSALLGFFSYGKINLPTDT
jgi:anaerobic magnesium-protoporphyrin IX monomethyl ester cyclase